MHFDFTSPPLSTVSFFCNRWSEKKKWFGPSLCFFSRFHVYKGWMNFWCLCMLVSCWPCFAVAPPVRTDAQCQAQHIWKEMALRTWGQEKPGGFLIVGQDYVTKLKVKTNIWLFLKYSLSLPLSFKTQIFFYSALPSAPSSQPQAGRDLNIPLSHSQMQTSETAGRIERAEGAFLRSFSFSLRKYHYVLPFHNSKLVPVLMGRVSSTIAYFDLVKWYMHFTGEKSFLPAFLLSLLPNPFLCAGHSLFLVWKWSDSRCSVTVINLLCWSSRWN